MKLTSIIKKNFKLLIRSKASAFIVLIGPLLIILLIGFVFSSKTSYELNLGYYAPTQNELTKAFTDSLEQSHYYIQEFKDEQSCVKKIEQNIIHTCIIFPEDFQINQEQRNELRFLVDYSRMNLVYKIIDSVSGILDIETKELSQSLTQTLLSRINTTLKDISADLVLIGEINPKLNLLMLDLQKVRADSEAMKFEVKEVNLENIEEDVSSINETLTQIREKGKDIINESEQWIDELLDDLGEDEIEDQADDENATYHEEAESFEDLRYELLDLYNTSPEKIEDMMDTLDDISGSLLELESQMTKNKEFNKDIQQKVDSAKNNLANIQSSLIDLKNTLEKSKQNLESIAITRAETIVSPVNTRIEPIVSETSKLTFIFPFILVLVIMFVALLLSSTLIIFEKNSKAFFRNSITPTRPEFFVITTFITSFVVIVIQTLIILGLSNFFLHIPLFKNALATLLIIFVTAAFFIVLGMGVGYLFFTQEGAIMASIVLGSLFMFLSNLVIPLESIAPALSGIIKYNPYVLASELLRKSLLFKVELTEALIIILILFGAFVILFLIIIFLHGIVYKKRVKPPVDVLEDKLLHEKETQPAQPTLPKGVISAINKRELLQQVFDMTKAEFEENVNIRQNKIADWVETKLKNKRLASKLRKTFSRMEMLRILTEDIKKEEKKEKKEKKD